MGWKGKSLNVYSCPHWQIWDLNSGTPIQYRKLASPVRPVRNWTKAELSAFRRFWHEAEKLFVQVLETRRRVLVAEHPDMLNSMNSLASTFWNQRRWQEAEQLFVQVLETILIIRVRTLPLLHCVAGRQSSWILVLQAGKSTANPSAHGINTGTNLLCLLVWSLKVKVQNRFYQFIGVAAVPAISKRQVKPSRYFDF